MKTNAKKTAVKAVKKAEPKKSAAPKKKAVKPAEKAPKGGLMKKCPTCGRMLPLSEFHKDRTRKDGVKATCKECCAKAKKQRAKVRKYTKDVPTKEVREKIVSKGLAPKKKAEKPAKKKAVVSGTKGKVSMTLCVDADKKPTMRTVTDIIENFIAGVASALGFNPKAWEVREHVDVD